MNPIADPRIANGMKKQLAALREKLAAGETPLGWKVGMSTPAAKESHADHGTDGRLYAAQRAGAVGRDRLAQRLGEADRGSRNRRAYWA